MMNSRVLLNNGLGTLAGLSIRRSSLTIFPKEKEEAINEWQGELENDKIPPELFEPKIQQDDSMFDNKYFLIFSTADKQTGIDYYEVKQGELGWVRGRSPYLLENQDLLGKIEVKAVDMAGNQRIVEAVLAQNPNQFIFWLVIFAFLAVMITAVIAIFKRKRKKSYESISFQ